MKITISRDTAELLDALDDLELAKTMRVAFHYVFGGRVIPPLPGNLDVVWRVFKARIDRTRKPDELRAAKMRAAKAAKRARG